ncbi:MAG TPA: hypothetical protein VN893_21760, partial [Bryobacteraceae bacterium]|nr:hypothetical protein [Bryobacteraceae bacterium]
EPLLSKPIYRVKGWAGLGRVHSEHVYQYIAWRALLTSDFPFAVVPERDKRDLWLCESAECEQPAAIGEMKVWKTEGAEFVRSDIAARQNDRACPGFILVTTVQEVRSHDDNFDFLATELADLGVKRDDFEEFCFPALWREGENIREHEFALIGFMVSPRAKA